MRIKCRNIWMLISWVLMFYFLYGGEDLCFKEVHKGFGKDEVSWWQVKNGSGKNKNKSLYSICNFSIMWDYFQNNKKSIL